MFFAPIPIDPALTDNPYLHIPDGFLSLPISLVAWLVTLGVLAYAVRRAHEDYEERLAPLAGVMAAFIFAGQMINFPVPGGLSGHLVGATLAFVVLGPWLGLLAMTAVIVLQAILFQDGGLVVMGANILVMGIVPGMVGYGVYQWGNRLQGRARQWLVGAGAWLSVIAAAVITTFLLTFSQTTSLNITLPAMVLSHTLIGIGEGLITVAALAYIVRIRPGLVNQSAAAGGGMRWVLGGAAIALAITLFAPLASAAPDGLEWVAGQAGFIEAAQDAPFELLPDYTLPFLGESGASTIGAGLVGVILVGAFTLLITRVIRKPEGETRQKIDGRV